MQKSPADLKAEVDSAERAVAALRDELIERLRAAADPRTRDALNTVNVALTLVVGLEYPMGGVQREMLEQARDALQATLPAVSAASV